MSSRRSLAAAASVIMLGNVASRLLGIVRVQVIAGLFGATATSSAFIAAATIPTMVYDLLIGGAISAALIPVFSDYAALRREQGEKAATEARRELAAAASALLSLAFVALAILVVLLIAIAPWLVTILIPGLAAATQAQTIDLVRVMLPGVIFLGLSGVTTALLYARQVFGYPAFAVSVYNAGIVAFALLFARYVGVNSLALGVVAGAIGQLALQYPGLRDLRLRFKLDWRHPAVRRVIALYTPVALGLVVSQLGVLIDRNLASRTGEESIAAMAFATTLVQFPLGLTATALSFAILPALSRVAGDPARYKATLATGLRLVSLAILPATTALLFLHVPVIQVLFEHGVFDERGTAVTALAFVYYAPQLPFAAVDQILIFAFYARKNTLTPMLVGVLGVLIYLVAGISLTGALGWGMRGLALANTLQNSLHAIVLFLLLRSTIGSLRGHGIFQTLGKATVGSLAMAAVLWAAGPALRLGTEPATLFGQAAYLASGVVLAGVAYVLALWVLRTEEVSAAWCLIVARLRPRR